MNTESEHDGPFWNCPACRELREQAEKAALARIRELTAPNEQDEQLLAKITH